MRVSEAQATAGQDGDEDEMLQYIRLQAEGGDARAMMQMGRLAYAGQRGIARDPAAALDYFERAAEQGNVEAEFNLGVLESRGEGAAAALDCALYSLDWAPTCTMLAAGMGDGSVSLYRVGPGR